MEASTGRKLLKIINFGCQMNAADAERMAGQLAAIGYEETDSLDAADLVLIHTCCVRESAENRVYGKIGEIKGLKRERPQLIFGVTGCMAQKEGDALIRRAPHIDFVLGTGRIQELARVVERIEARREHVVDVAMESAGLPEQMPIARGSGVSAWVPIMYGCNNFCTYCIVPYVRGRERSRQPESILAEVEEAIAHGCKEVTLLGQNVNSYGKDHGRENFAGLLRRVDRVPGIRRVRFMTSHPKDLGDDVIAAIRDGEHLCEHIHLPVQYGSNRILKAMNRRYTVESYRELVGRIRAALPKASITTDLIVGFPGEREEDFLETLGFLREIRFDAAYTFLYSRRSGTPAAQMPGQVEDAEKRRRLQELMAVQNAISLEIHEALRGQALEVMAEGPSKTDPAIYTGRTRTGKLVHFPHGEEQPGDFLPVRILQPQTWALKGERADGKERIGR